MLRLLFGLFVCVLVCFASLLCFVCRSVVVDCYCVLIFDWFTLA